jgi:hypothetical protein
MVGRQKGGGVKTSKVQWTLFCQDFKGLFILEYEDTGMELKEQTHVWQKELAFIQDHVFPKASWGVFKQLAGNYIFSDRRCQPHPSWKLFAQEVFHQTQLVNYTPIRQEHAVFGYVDIIFEHAFWGIYRLNITPGSSIPLHKHMYMQEVEKILTPGLHLISLNSSAWMPCGSVHERPLGEVHGYTNPTKCLQSILCVNHPIFDPADEVLA